MAQLTAEERSAMSKRSAQTMRDRYGNDYFNRLGKRGYASVKDKYGRSILDFSHDRIQELTKLHYAHPEDVPADSVE